MSSHFLTDKSLALEARFGGWALAKPRAFGEPGVGPTYAADRSCEVKRIAVDLAIDPVARTLRGVARLELGPLAGREGAWELDLDGVTVDAVEDGAGRRVDAKHADGKLRFPPTDTLVVRYHGRPPRGLWFVGPTKAEPDRAPEAWTQCQDEDAHFLFPCIDQPGVKHPFSIRITAPAGFTVVSNGRFAGRDGDTWMWEVAEPMPPYLFSAVVARMDEHAGEGDVPLRYLVPAGTPADKVARAFGRTPRMMAFLSERYGAYPWPRYDQVAVHDFIFGGMENVAATTLTDLVLADDRAAMDWDADDLVVHELAHQWFGDLLTCQDWSQGWLNEGWATYTEHLWAGVDRGRDEADWHLFEQLGNYLAELGGRYRRPIVSYQYKAPIDLFDRHLYEKAALVLHTLRNHLGDEAFWPGVALYLERHRHSTVHTRHFQRAMEDATGRNLDRFFAQWILGPGHPSLEVTIARGDGGATVTVKQTQEEEPFSFPLQVNDTRLSIEARERTYTIPGDGPVRVDPKFALCAEIKLKAPRSMLEELLASDPSVVGRVRAARALADDGAVEPLVKALRTDGFWGVRAEIADLLATRGGDVATAALVEALNDPHPKARRRVVAALGGVRRPEVAAALRAHTDASVQVEGEVAKSLGRLRAEGAREACEALLARSSWGEVLRCRALEGLGHLRDTAVVGTIVAWTGDDKPARARAAACAALGRLGDEVEACRTVAVERLCELADDGNFRVQVAAIVALGYLRDARALGTLTRVHASAGDGRCRRLAFEAMASIREGRTSEDGLATVRGQLESLIEENRKLRDRVGKLEERR
ncbi:MAG: M1 family aminopeptidase [Myxococcota bacterium]